mgnify:CR=1 FL=1
MEAIRRRSRSPRRGDRGDRESISLRPTVFNFMRGALISNEFPSYVLNLPDDQKLQHIGFPLGRIAGGELVVDGNNNIQLWTQVSKMWDPSPSSDYNRLQPVLERLGSGYEVIYRYAADIERSKQANPQEGFQRKRRTRRKHTRSSRRKRRSKRKSRARR